MLELGQHKQVARVVQYKQAELLAREQAFPTRQNPATQNRRYPVSLIPWEYQYNLEKQSRILVAVAVAVALAAAAAVAAAVAEPHIQAVALRQAQE